MTSNQDLRTAIFNETDPEQKEILLRFLRERDSPNVREIGIEQQASFMNGPHSGFYYQDFIARMSTLRESACYLEIGVQCGFNLAKVSTKTAIGVDPGFNITVDITSNKEAAFLYRMTSDHFFRSMADKVFRDTAVDLAFLDGMHLFEFLLRDFYNTEKNCRKGALITMHDCLPFDGEMIERYYNKEGRTPGEYEGLWTGDVWKIIPILKKYRPDLTLKLLDCHPTGLVCVSNLDPSNTVLKDNYEKIVAEFSILPNERASIESLYSVHEIINAEIIINNYDHSLFFAQ